ncbi:MAG TPA: glycosyltransferase family 4 protein [Candidatus Woesearchaeota archaeon]|nr:glycosyltransferase family 4 protein [Candidatus Woesearchaeota archaeon]
MKTIVIASDSYLPRWDGISRFLFEIIPMLSKKYNVLVIAPNFSGQSRIFENVHTLRIPLTNLKAGDYSIPKFKFRVISKAISKADLVWVNTSGSIGICSILLSKLMKKPLLYYVHSIDWELFQLSIKGCLIKKRFVRFITRLIQRFLLNRVDLIMVPSNEVGEKISSLGVKSNKVAIRLGVNLKNFHPAINKEEAKQKLGIDKNSIVIGFCGRLAREKNLKVLYRAFRRLKMDIKHKNPKLLIVGDGILDIKEQFSKLPDTILVGSVDNPQDYYQAMDIFVLPSFTETTGLVLLEAMASQIPVISSKVGIASEIIKNGKNGYLFDPYSDYELYKILKKLSLETEIREKIGKAGMELIHNRFSWENTTTSISDLMDTYLENTQ